MHRFLSTLAVLSVLGFTAAGSAEEKKKEKAKGQRPPRKPSSRRWTPTATAR